MLLSIPERILLLNVLPAAEGNYLFLRSIRTLKESLGFSEEEAAEVSLSGAGGKFTWSPDKNPMKEIEIGPVMAKYVSESIVAAKSLREEHFQFYSRFVQEETV